MTSQRQLMNDFNIESCWIPVFFFNILRLRRVHVLQIITAIRILISGSALSEILDIFFVF